MRISGGNVLKIMIFSWIALNLAACIETAADLSAARQKPQVQAPAIPVTLVSLEGAPDEVTARFNLALTNEAKARQILLVSNNDKPRFKLKGYVSAYAVQGGTAISWVWDMYDSRQQRAQRIDGAQLIKRNENDPWNVVDDAILKFAAASSMNDVATYLSNAQLPALTIDKPASNNKLPNQIRPSPSLPATPGSSQAVASVEQIPNDLVNPEIKALFFAPQ